MAKSCYTRRPLDPNLFSQTKLHDHKWEKQVGKSQNPRAKQDLIRLKKRPTHKTEKNPSKANRWPQGKMLCNNYPHKRDRHAYCKSAWLVEMGGGPNVEQQAGPFTSCLWCVMVRRNLCSLSQSYWLCWTPPPVLSSSPRSFVRASTCDWVFSESWIGVDRWVV